MGEGDRVMQSSTAPATRVPQNMTVREAIIALARMTDQDAEIAVSFYNSDPIPVQDIEESEDGRVVFNGS